MKHKLLPIITSLFLTLVLLIIAVKFTINFRPLYYFDIDYLNITEKADVSKEEIILNYDTVIDYLKTRDNQPLNLPTFKQSAEGIQHFEDVRNILISIDYLFVFSLIGALILIYFSYKRQDYLFYRYTSFLLIITPVIMAIPMFINFDRLFTLFHEVLFSNDLWLLNPYTDPIINIFPQRFFMHSALLILSIIFIASFISNSMYHYHLKRFQKKHRL